MHRNRDALGRIPRRAPAGRPRPGPCVRLTRLLLAGIVAPAACSSGNELNIHDHGVLMPTLRLEVPKHSTAATGGLANEATPGPTPSRGPFGLGSELTFGSGTFLGGAGEYDLTSWQLLFYLGSDPARGAAFDGRLLFGTEYLQLDVRGSGTSGAAREEGGSFGVLGGFETDLHLAPGCVLYARGTASALAPDTSSLRGELGLRLQPAAQLELFGGYRFWRVQREDLFEGALFGGGADIDLHTDGILVGLGIVF